MLNIEINGRPAEVEDVHRVAVRNFGHFTSMQVRDDVLFVGRDGRLREGSVWNVAFWDGRQVVWPDADVLPGVTMQLLQRGLTRVGVPWAVLPLTSADLPSLEAGAAANSLCPCQPLAGIDRTAFPGDGGALVEALGAAWAGVPWDTL
ncbi:aminotransferase class IV [Kitasatospora brasiliensis]|uniref:aminotransferase class IV n=1 Tax=Kitasatospora brasiliensis TaxID=3058040 RepID=UPI00292E55DE|nr:aminotransferase class IV [Kitasatospora sp. K002]